MAGIGRLSRTSIIAAVFGCLGSALYPHWANSATPPVAPANPSQESPNSGEAPDCEAILNGLKGSVTNLNMDREFAQDMIRGPLTDSAGLACRAAAMLMLRSKDVGRAALYFKKGCLSGDFDSCAALYQGRVKLPADLSAETVSTKLCEIRIAEMEYRSSSSDGDDCPIGPGEWCGTEKNADWCFQTALEPPPGDCGGGMTKKDLDPYMKIACDLGSSNACVLTGAYAKACAGRNAFGCFLSGKTQASLKMFQDKCDAPAPKK